MALPIHHPIAVSPRTGGALNSIETINANQDGPLSALRGPPISTKGIGKVISQLAQTLKFFFTAFDGEKSLPLPPAGSSPEEYLDAIHSVAATRPKFSMQNGTSPNGPQPTGGRRSIRGRENVPAPGALPGAGAAASSSPAALPVGTGSPSVAVPEPTISPVTTPAAPEVPPVMVDPPAGVTIAPDTAAQLVGTVLAIVNSILGQEFHPGTLQPGVYSGIINGIKGGLAKRAIMTPETQQLFALAQAKYVELKQALENFQSLQHSHNHKRELGGMNMEEVNTLLNILNE